MSYHPFVEIQPSRKGKLVGIAFVVFGLFVVGVAAYHFATGSPLTFNTGTHATGTDYIGSDSQVALYGAFGLLPIAFGGMYLLWCRNARLIALPEGVEIKNWRGQISARVPWEAITALDEETTRDGEGYYVLRTASGSRSLRRFDGLDVFAAEIRRRSPQLRAGATSSVS